MVGLTGGRWGIGGGTGDTEADRNVRAPAIGGGIAGWAGDTGAPVSDPARWIGASSVGQVRAGDTGGISAGKIETAGPSSVVFAGGGEAVSASCRGGRVAGVKLAVSSAAVLAAANVESFSFANSRSRSSTRRVSSSIRFRALMARAINQIPAASGTPRMSRMIGIMICSIIRWVQCLRPLYTQAACGRELKKHL